MGAPVGGEARVRAVGGRKRLGLPLLVALLALLLPQTATATFHEIVVREVYAGGASNDSYVVLQAYSGGQNFVGGHAVTAYNAAGAAIGTFTFPGNVSSGQSQMTILVADTAYASAFPSGPLPDGTMASLDLSPAGGAVCWAGLDCVNWGSFSGMTSPASGTPASPGGISAGMAIRRTIAPGCPTLLEFADDSNVSAVDFFEAAPNPRANSSPIVEAICPPAPDTTIGTKPPNRTNATAATFTFTASPAAGATFECRLDAEPSFGACTSPREYTGLAGGAGTSHTFQVRAKNASGTDPTPATHTWTVDTEAPAVTITESPEDPSPGGSALFRFQANEASTFQCSQVAGDGPDGFGGCSSPRTYTNLGDGPHTFKVRATDTAGNQGAPSVYAWTVDNLLADTVPPETTILAKPPNPSDSSTAAFTYASNEPGSSFECKLDAAPFASCPAAGVSYPGLAGGPHSFQVRATDEAGNTDPSPAGYSWDVAIVNPIQLPPAIPPPSSGGDARRVPQTTIVARPGAVTRDRTPTFRFRSSLPGSRFACKVDKGGFKPCSSPFTTKPLSYGPHTVQVRASAGGAVDPSPARSSFRVAKPKRKRAR